MSEPGFARRVAPAVVLAVAGGILLYLLPGGGDNDPSSAANIGAPESTSSPQRKSHGKPTASTPKVITGDAVNFQYGTVQVKVTLDGTTITDITTLTAPGGSYQPYTDRTIPEMKSKIITAQSTRVAAASGATYTSNAYAQSVQSALNQA
ncbi:MAG: FMN-binding protein [Actinomycetia bacterium]|nr:FMN-binding protein [Actinomycetes bacterium]